jgi:hypothetical protein
MSEKIERCNRCIQKCIDYLNFNTDFICVDCVDKPVALQININGKSCDACVHPYLCYDCYVKYLKMYGDNFTIYII